MTGFTSLAYSAPWLVLLAGGLTIAGLLGAGNAIGARLRLPQPWMTVVGCVAAVEVYTLGVEAIAMAQVATRAVLIGWWLVFSMAGATLLWSGGRPRPPYAARGRAALHAILAVNLFVATRPSTKGDEVYYHMIVPCRIVLDHGLLFYREPMRAAILPQMAFQIGFAPFHAMRLPDAGNVVSWFFSALVVWFAYSIVKSKTGSTRWATLFATAVVAGLYTTVFHVTSGAHAIGDLAVTAAVVALYCLDDPLSIGILAAAAASTKILLFPFSAVIVILAAIRTRRIVPLIAPGLLLVAPLMIWTAIHAGSPFGPLMEGSTGPSPYRPGEVRAFVDEYVGGPRGAIPEKLRNEAVNYSPVLWLSIAALVVMRKRVKINPAIAFALLVLQAVIILGWNTYDARYFGGVHYALMLLFAMFLADDVRERWTAHRRFVAVAALLIVPWMLMQFVYAAAFVKPKNELLRAYVPLFDDFVALDRILPKDATILSAGYGLASIYAPRRLEYHPLDVRSTGPVYLLTWSDARPRASSVYSNDHAVIAAFRIFGREPLRARLRVWRVR